MGRLDGKVAIVTGAARGQGAVEVAQMVAEGARVVAADVLDEEGEALVAGLGDAATFAHLDVGDPDGWDAVVEVATRAYGGIDVLVNNAGIFRFTPIGKTTADEFLEVVRVNQLGCFLGIQAVARPMRARGGGSIVNISSIAGLRGGPMTSAYSATKFAMRGLTKVAAFELASAKIRVNSVHPGFIDTAMLGALLGSTDDTTRSAIEARVPIGEISTPEDVAPLVLFLASDESRHCTGGEFVVDGGVSAGLSLNG